jgi:hypothetical protein
MGGWNLWPRALISLRDLTPIRKGEREKAINILGGTQSVQNN